MIRLYQASNLPQAQLLIDLLAQNHIQAQLNNVNAGGAMGEVPFTHAYPEVWIKREQDLPRARELVQEFESPTESGVWSCSSCQETSPMNFDFCWACQTPR